jgi:hypothetical protein
LDIDSEKSIKEVVDGQQRIRSILEFIDGSFGALHPDHKKRLLYRDLHPKEREKFLMTSLSVGYLIGADDSDVIEIFGRLNSVAKTLNEQEKRNARFSGEMKQFCLNSAATHVQLWRDLGIFTANDIARMSEVQFVAELALNMINGLSDYSATVIDKFYKEYDDDFPMQEELKDRMEMVFSKIADLDAGVIRDTIFSRHPIFFSLFLVLDSINGRIAKVRLENALHAVDANFTSDIPFAEREKDDADFYMACTSTTQRIKQRTIRNQYLKRALHIS